MQALLELVPLAAFLVAYYTARHLRGHRGADGRDAGAAASWIWLRSGASHRCTAVSAALVLALGAATLILHDQRFLQVEAHDVLLAVALAFLVSVWIGERTARAASAGHGLGAARLRAAARRGVGSTGSGSLFYALLGGRQPAGGLQCQRAHLGQLQGVWSHRALTVVFAAAAARRGCRGPRPARPRCDLSTPMTPATPMRARIGRQYPQAARAQLAALQPLQLEVRDDSAAHAGHAGAREGGTSRVRIVSEQFRGRYTPATASAASMRRWRELLGTRDPCAGA